MKEYLKHRTALTFLVGAVLFCSACTTLMHRPFTARQPDALMPQDDLRQAIYDGQTWLTAFQAKDGLFHYLYTPQDNSYADKNNFVRQMGSYWSLIESLKFRKTKKALETIETFHKTIGKYKRTGEAGQNEILYFGFAGESKINTVALYVCAVVGRIKQGLPTTRQERKDLEKAVRGLMEMAAQDGGFYYIYYIPKQHNLITPYGSGEALLALAMYYDLTGDQTVRNFARKQFDLYFAREFTGKGAFKDKNRKSFFTWGLYYLREMDRHDPDPAAYENYVRPMIRLALDHRKNNELCKNKGCLLSESLGDASFLEGMAAAYSLAGKYETDEKLILELEDYLHKAAKLIRGMQITSVQKFESMTKTKFKGAPQQLIGGFCTPPKCEMMRNDMTQHALTGLSEYYKLFYPLTAQSQ